MFNFFRSKHKDDSRLFFHTDVHSHLVPGIDDGSTNVEKSVELAERMHSWGLDRLIVTPHVTQDTFENTPDTITPPFNALKKAIEDKGLDIDISHSAEYRLDEFFIKQLECGNLRPMPNNYLLVECSYLQEPWDLDSILFNLMLKGYKPILAHPERYHYYHQHKERYERLHAGGTLFQVNLLSLAEHYGRDEKMIAEYLLEKNMIDFLGTDLHSRHHAAAIEEYLNSKSYRKHRRALEGRIMNDTAFKP